MPKTVIIIDDDQDDLDVIKDVIKLIDDSILCITFTHPEEALRVITKELIFSPDIILSDINMPRMHGAVLLKKLRETPALNDTIIAMLSTSMANPLANTLTESGADFVLQKPVKMDDYHAMLHRIFLMQRSSAQNQTPPHDRGVATAPMSFGDLILDDLVHEKASIYIIDYAWNYLFANTTAIKKVNGYGIVGKNITDVWKELPQFNFEPVYLMLKDKVNNRVSMEINQRSPLTRTSIKITGKPLADCYLFNISEVPEDSTKSI
ncbi:response regulator [Pseudochryseolinea flava]|uniref:Response regulatory domain-containing protein n=1 Tax=Pseudochryseolinea flava TaxID=2059302 RepID=A0A364Y593_9BACT|nr:response regulator [Pseudochryseolinea flava]RAW02166.1 hypothetical protein DQQ10_06365 [Pseudochryseolinea flava]